MNRPIYDVGETFTTDEGIECVVVECVGLFGGTCKRMDTGEIIPFRVGRRIPPRGWDRVEGLRKEGP